MFMLRPPVKRSRLLQLLSQLATSPKLAKLKSQKAVSRGPCAVCLVVSLRSTAIHASILLALRRPRALVVGLPTLPSSPGSGTLLLLPPPLLLLLAVSTLPVAVLLQVVARSPELG